MIKINYENHLKDRNFNIEDEYKKIFTEKFNIKYERKIRNEFLNTTGKYQFTNEKTKSLEEIFDTFQVNKISEFDSIYENRNLDDILILSTKDIILSLQKNGKKSNLSQLKYFFNYTKFQKEITKFFTNNFNFTTCFYCNKDFINNFQKEKNELISTFQLDHFYDKGTYPYLALSFYNLIPSCPTCNSSKVKGSKDTFKNDSQIGNFDNETCIIPNNENFNFHQKVKFKLFLSDSCKNLYIKDKEDITIPLRENYSDEYSKYIEVFKLNDRYEVNKDIVFEMIQKAELYPESRLKELENLTGIPYQQIKKDIFNLIDENEDLSKKPFSKLIVDISKELGLQ